MEAATPAPPPPPPPTPPPAPAGPSDYPVSFDVEYPERLSHWTNQLLSVTGALSRAMTAAEVADAAVPEFLHALDAATALVAVVSSDGKQAHVASAAGFDPVLSSGLPLSLDSGTLLALR